MLTAYQAYNHTSCFVISFIIILAIAARYSEACRDLGAHLFYIWGIVSILMSFFSASCKFNKLPAAFYALFMLWSPITDSFFPSAPSTLYNGISVNMLAGACFLLIPCYICGQSKDGKGDILMEGLEDMLLQPLVVGIMTVGWIPACFLAAVTGFHVD